MLCVGSANAQIANAACNVQEPWISADYSSLSVTVTDDGYVLCSNTVQNEANVIGSVSDFAFIDMNGIACSAEIAVRDNTNTYPAGTFAGYKIGTESLIAGVSVASTVTISTYNNGTLVDNQVVVSSLLGLDLDLVGADGLATVGFISDFDFDEIRITYTALVGLFEGQVYHPVIQKFCSGPDTPCNEVTTITSPAHPLSISEENTGLTGVACLVCSVGNPNNLVNAIPNDFASLNVDVGLLAGAQISVENEIDDYPAGTYAGFDIENSSLLDIGVLDNITIRTYLDGSLQETKNGVSELADVGSGLLFGSTRRIVGFVTSLPFDEVQIETYNLASVDIGSTNVYGLVIQRFCSGPDLGCNDLQAIANPEHPLYINPDRSGLLSGVCVACGVSNAQNVINDDDTDFANINTTVGVLSDVGLSVRNQIDDYPAGTYAGFDVRTTGLLDVTLLDQITINTYLDGVLVDSKSGQSELVSAQTSLLTPSERKTIGFISEGTFDEVQIVVENLVAVDLGTIEVHGVIFSSFCAIEIVCDTTFFLTNTNFPVIVDYFKTGTDGVACVGNSVTNTDNVINNDPNSYAEITVIAGVACPASLAVLDALDSFPIGSKAGFVIEVTDPLILNLGVGLFDNIIIETYLNGNLQESRTGVSNLIDVELLFLYINDLEGRFNLGFETTKVYDEVRIVVNSLVGITNKVNVYSAFVDTRGATGDGFNCCPVIAPELSATTLTNVCDTKTVDISALEISTAPNNSTLVWFTTDEPTGEAYATPGQAIAGSYYAYYYDSVNDCYSPASEEVVVSIIDCADLEIGVAVDEATPEVGDTVTFTITITNNGPDGATNVVGYDTLPSGYVFVESSTASGSYDETTGLWTIGGLALNESVTLTIKAEVAYGGEYDNAVHVTGDEDDSDDANNHDNIATTPIDPCDPAGQSVDVDCDSDGLTNNEELTGIDDPNTIPDPNGNMTDPDDPDTDGDGVTDGDEAIDETNPNNPCEFDPTSVTLTPELAFDDLDCDGDGVTNIDELTDLTNILDPCDFVLSSVSQNATSTGDCDGDGVTDADEINGLDDDYSTPGDNTDPNDPCDFNIEDQGTPGAGWLTADCDGDGVTNGDEYAGLDDDPATTGDNTNPLDPCDYNLVDQGIPSAEWLTADCDGDGATNGDEYAGLDDDPLTTEDNTNPLDPCEYNVADQGTPSAAWLGGDCDGDGVTNGDEYAGLDDDPATTGDNTDPNDACSLNLADVSQNATSTGDCDGDGVTDADEINGTDGDYSTPGDNSDPNNACSLNLADVSQNATSTGDCDGDGVTDADEINGTDGDYSTPGDNTDPNDACSLNLADVSQNATSTGDCDGDGVTDADEINGTDGDYSTPGDNTDPNDACSLNLADVSQNATSTGDCDGDGVTDADEINGTDSDYSTGGDNTNPLDACDYNVDDISATVTADQSGCNLLYAMNDINVTIKGIPVTGNVLTNDSDPENDGFEITKIITGGALNPSPGGSSILLPSGNSLVMGSGGNYVFTPLFGFIGEEKFSYIICDEGEPEKCDTADVVINVSPLPIEMNNAPIANDDNGRTPNDEALSGNVMSNDNDIDGDAISVTQVVTQPTNGTITIDPNGDFVYTPNSGFVGKDKVEYEICDDGTPSECDNAILTIVVTETDGENEIYCNDDSGMGWSNSSINIPVLENDTDPEGDTPTIPEIISGPSNGTAVVNADSTITYTPGNDYSGNDELVYRICDDLEPTVCDTATVYFTVFERMCHELELSVFLEGPYDANTGLMTTKLNEFHLLPGQDVDNFIPGLGVVTPIGQPYNIAPWNYNGTEGNNYGEESTNPGSTPYPSNITDWVLVSVREAGISAANVMWTCAGMLASNGSVEFPEECPCLELDPSEVYHVVVEHRNHLPIMSNAISPALGNLSIDFTTTDSWKFNIGSPQEVTQKLTNGKFLMYAANGIQGSGRTDINSSDNSIWLQDNSTIFQYKYGDFDLNADVNSADFFLYIINVSRFNILNF
ncbi:Ig-like domain-containing protein [Portibacter lacus]|uniref:DUF11 domain-containing protein n=1 Tax=Portibacter lacus TaxID=1099794 RepID=A0AA37WCV5_9BACT|nr:Ig-like domain-containing protein [Portibacter lacus]GLR16976.1 hypothetical protein GCM10007940_15910 [Portibacter lacus]